MNTQLPLAIQLNDEATLADFSWNTNELLQQQITEILSSKQERFLYLWGAKGCGKSHLLQACCHAIHTKDSAIYLPLTLLKEWGPQSVADLENQSLIAIDDIDIIAKDPEWEEALFHLYNRIRASDQGILIISGSQTPNTLPIQLADLQSRLNWGLVLQINELNDVEKIKTLKTHALKRGFDLPESVGQFLLSRCSRNMHDLHNILNKLDDASLAAHRKITIPFVKSILQI